MAIDPHNNQVSLYDVSNSTQNDLKHLGYDYTQTLMQKTLSNYLFRNSKVAGFLEKLNNYMVQHVELVKYVRIYFNYTVPKNYKKID